MFARNSEGRWLTARSIELGYDPLDEQSMTGFRSAAAGLSGFLLKS
jgi:hypothetical protein